MTDDELIAALAAPVTRGKTDGLRVTAARRLEEVVAALQACQAAAHDLAECHDLPIEDYWHAIDRICTAALSQDHIRMSEERFTTRLQVLCAVMGPRVMREPAIAAHVVQALIEAAGFTIAIGSHGKPELIGIMAEGSSQHLFEVCADKQRAAAGISGLISKWPE